MQLWSYRAMYLTLAGWLSITVLSNKSILPSWAYVFYSKLFFFFCDKVLEEKQEERLIWFMIALPHWELYWANTSCQRQVAEEICSTWGNQEAKRVTRRLEFYCCFEGHTPREPAGFYHLTNEASAGEEDYSTLVCGPFRPKPWRLLLLPSLSCHSFKFHSPLGPFLNSS